MVFSDLELGLGVAEVCILAIGKHFEILGFDLAFLGFGKTSEILVDFAARSQLRVEGLEEMAEL